MGSRQNKNQNNGDRNSKNSNALGSAFHDLPSPQHYDPSWYNNKLRGEFGQLGGGGGDAAAGSGGGGSGAGGSGGGLRRCSGPILPKSYHIISEDFDDFPETDDDSYLTSTLRSRSGGLIFQEIAQGGGNKLHVRIDDEHTVSPIVSAPRDLNGNGKDSDRGMGILASPVTNEFEHVMRDGDGNGDIEDPGIGRQDLHFHMEKKSSSDNDQVVPPSQPQGLKKGGGFRFGRKSVLGDLSSQKEDGNEGVHFGGVSRGRPSRMFRPSLLFGQGERGDRPGRPSKSFLRSGGRTRTRTKVFAGRWVIVFDWGYHPADSLKKVTLMLEKYFRATACTSAKDNEVRMQIPFEVEDSTKVKSGTYSIVVSAEQNEDGGSRVSFRRSLGDLFRGGSDEFGWLCAQITERVCEVHPGTSMIFPVN